MALCAETCACFFWFIYASFFEWFIHRHIMHARRFPLTGAFDKHTLLHHQIYKGDNFLARGPERPRHITLRRHTFLSILLIHLPFFGLFQVVTGLPTLWGAVTAFGLYYAAYEYMHYLMHAPRGHFVERFRWFLFLREHHRLHHKYMLRNLNVLLPLGDFCFGTLVTGEGRYSKRAKRQRMLAHCRK